MGGFQGIASGLGEAGEQLGTGINNAEQMALKLRQQSHLENVDAQHIALAQALQKQQYDLAQQQHELMRQQMIANGWSQVARTVKGADGKYYQQYDNPRMPPGQQTSRIPYEGGVPPDSPEGLMQSYKYYASQLDDKGSPLFNHREITKKVMGLDDLYHQGPAQVLQGLREDAEQLAKSGQKFVIVPGFGKVPIDTPEGRSRYAQINADSYWGKGAFLRASMGIGAKPVDMTGWTANEQREYKALENEALRKEAAISKMADTAMANSLQTMTDPAGAMKSTFDMYNEVIGPLHNQLQAKQDEINGRHGRTGPGGAPQKNAYKIGNVWYDAATHLPIPTNKW